jgi:hypothetical protein
MQQWNFTIKAISQADASTQIAAQSCPAYVKDYLNAVVADMGPPPAGKHGYLINSRNDNSHVTDDIEFS